jgi:murein DD-endopeptidase MepM/ murein hydrolase activator NlpD
MTNDFYTLIIVPHAKARFKKVQVSVQLSRWMTGVALGLVVALAGILLHYSWLTVKVWELRRLRAQNQELAEKTAAYAKTTGRLQAQVAVLNGMVKKLGIMAGLDGTLPDAAVGGVGGVPGTEAIPPSTGVGETLLQMEQRVTDLTERSARLEEFFTDQKALLASTPSIWPARGYLSASFGNRIDPFTSQKDFHAGVDVSTPRGTKIIAPADGIVVSCSPAGGYGNALVIDHGHGIVTRYGHLDGYNVRPGQRVKRGDVIAFVGNSGRSTAPHLHYEVWVREQAQNPIHFILDEYRSFG